MIGREDKRERGWKGGRTEGREGGMTEEGRRERKNMKNA